MIAMDLQKQLAMAAVAKAHKRNGTQPPPEGQLPTKKTKKKGPILTGANGRASSEARKAAAAAVAARLGAGAVCGSSSSNADNSAVEKHRNMLRMGIPSSAVQSKMEREGLSQSIIDEVLNGKRTDSESDVSMGFEDHFDAVERYQKMARMGVPEPAIRSKMTAEGLPSQVIDKVLSEGKSSGGYENTNQTQQKGPQAPTKKFDAGLSKLSVDEEEIASQYRKMIKIGLPNGAVRHKMIANGVPQIIQNSVLVGEISTPSEAPNGVFHEPANAGVYHGTPAASAGATSRTWLRTRSAASNVSKRAFSPAAPAKTASTAKAQQIPNEGAKSSLTTYSRNVATDATETNIKPTSVVNVKSVKERASKSVSPISGDKDAKSPINARASDSTQVRLPRNAVVPEKRRYSSKKPEIVNKSTMGKRKSSSRMSGSINVKLIQKESSLMVSKSVNSRPVEKTTTSSGRSSLISHLSDKKFSSTALMPSNPNAPDTRRKPINVKAHEKRTPSKRTLTAGKTERKSSALASTSSTKARASIGTKPITVALNSPPSTSHEQAIKNHFLHSKSKIAVAPVLSGRASAVKTPRISNATTSHAVVDSPTPQHGTNAFSPVKKAVASTAVQKSSISLPVPIPVVAPQPAPTPLPSQLQGALATTGTTTRKKRRKKPYKTARGTTILADGSESHCNCAIM